MEFRTGNNAKVMISSHCIGVLSFVCDFGFLHCVIVTYVAEVSYEVVASIFRTGVEREGV
jgi:hypothetical protein